MGERVFWFLLGAGAVVAFQYVRKGKGS